MAGAKDCVVKVIPASVANPFVRAHHYSGKVVSNSQLHLGVFYQGGLHGVMSFGPSMDKRKVQGLVRNTGWSGFIELNRMAFDDVLPKNSESRCIAQAIRMIRKNAPHIRWIVSFADGAQCGDGTIYRASGFKLTGIRQNRTIVELPNGTRIAALSLETMADRPAIEKQCRELGIPCVYRTRHDWIKLGARFVPGYMLRYIYFVDKEAEKDLTVPILPFSAIDDANARMYKGEPLKSRKPIDGAREKHRSDATGIQPAEGGANPTFTHHSDTEGS